MILHCKNAEMTIIVISAFLQCKIIQFLLFFFSPIQICFRLNKKKFFSNFCFYFFPSSDLNILKKKSVNQVLKKIRPKGKKSQNQEKLHAQFNDEHEIVGILTFMSRMDFAL